MEPLRNRRSLSDSTKDILPTRQRPELFWDQRSHLITRHRLKIVTTLLHMGLKITNEWSYTLDTNMPLWDAQRQFYLPFTNKFHSHSFPYILLNYHHAVIFLHKIIISQLLQNFFALYVNQKCHCLLQKAAKLYLILSHLKTI